MVFELRQNVEYGEGLTGEEVDQPWGLCREVFGITPPDRELQAVVYDRDVSIAAVYSEKHVAVETGVRSL